MTTNRAQSNIRNVRIIGLLAAAMVSGTSLLDSGTARAALIQQIWHNIPMYQPTPNDATITQEMTYVSGTAAAYSFTNTNDAFQYSGSASTIAGFLGADAAGSALSDTNGTSYFATLATGYIKVTSAGNYVFNLGNTFNAVDDAARISVDGNMVVEQNYTATLTPYNATLFLTQGYHAFSLLYFQTGGGDGLTTVMTAPGGGAVTFTTTNSAPIPEPVGMAVLGTGLVGLAALRRRLSRPQTTSVPAPT